MRARTYSTLEVLDLIEQWTGVSVSDTQLRYHCFRLGKMAIYPRKTSGNLRWTRSNINDAIRALGLKRKR